MGCTPSKAALERPVKEVPHAFRLPTEQEAIEIRENCTAPLPSPAFPPWTAPLEVFAAELRTEHHLLALDLVTRGFYSANNKYFYDKGGHLDQRFVGTPPHGADLNKQLRSLLSTFMRFCDANQIHPWVAHGSLLGLTWNNAIADHLDNLEFQVAFDEMAKLKAMDQTLIEGVYLVDVNPHYPYRRLREGNNNIVDARVTDVRTGVSLDITALSCVTPATPHRVSCKYPKFLDANWLFPLRRSLLEDVEVWIPHNVTSILASEYKASGYAPGPYNGHQFNFFSRRWENKVSKKSFLSRPIPSS